MRKLLTGLLAAVLLLFPAACGQKDPSSSASSGVSSVSSLSQTDHDQQTDGLSLYREALQRLAVQVEEGSFRCGYAVENDSGAYVISTTGVMAVSHQDGFRFSNQTQTESGGSSLISSWFSDGGQVYAAAQGVTRRQAYDQTARERLTRLIRSYSYGLIDPAEAAAESQSVTPTDTGRTVSLTLRADSLSSIEKNYGEIFGSPYQIVGMELEAQLDPEDNLISAALYTEVCTTVEGQIASFTLSVQLHFSDLGADLSIQPPPEIDMDTAQDVDSLWAS